MNIEGLKRMPWIRSKPVRSILCLTAAVVVLTSVSVGTASAADKVERTLAGIKIFSPMSVVLRKYGTPTEVRIGGSTTGAPAAGGATSPFGPGGGPPGYGGPPPGYGGPGASADDSGAPTGPMGPFGPGGFPGAPGAGGAQPGGGVGIPIQSNMVTWIYDQPNGASYEFTFSSDGRVVQIHATGFKSGARTQKGISLGDKMSEVFDRYGYPDKQNISGKILNTIYMDRYHSVFQFYNGKLVGIIVAAVE